MSGTNYKSQLNEYCLDKWRATPTYECRRSQSPHADHAPLFDAAVVLPNKLKYAVKAVPGRARDAEQEAAKTALNLVDRSVQAIEYDDDDALEMPPPRRTRNAHGNTMKYKITKVSHHWAEARGVDSNGKHVVLKLKGIAMIGAREGDDLEVRVVTDAQNQ